MSLYDRLAHLDSTSIAKAVHSVTVDIEEALEEDCEVTLGHCGINCCEAARVIDGIIHRSKELRGK